MRISRLCAFLVLFSSLRIFVDCYLVIVSVRNVVSNAEEKYCGIKKDASPTDDTNGYKYVLANAGKFKTCPAPNFVNPQTTYHALFARLESSNCAFSKTIYAIKSNLSKLFLVSSNRPINSSLVNNISLVFLPLTYSTQLAAFMINSSIGNASFEVALEKNTLYDYALLILWAIATACVFIGAFLSRKEFLIMLYRKTRQVWRERANVEREMFYESQYQADPEKKNKEIASEEHTGIYTQHAGTFFFSVDLSDNKSSTAILSAATAASTNTLQVDGEEEIPRKRILCGLLEEDDGVYEKEEEEVVSIEDVNVPLLLFIEILLAVGFLLLLFFFYDVTIYIFYVVYVVLAARAMYKLACIGLNRTSCFTYRIRKNKIPILKERPQIRKFPVIVVCLIFCIICWSWVLQDVMGIAVSLYSLTLIQFHSFKFVALLLIVFFLYDVFMVFLSPYLTKGNSIMEAVVNGGKVYSSVQEDWSSVYFESGFELINRIPIIISIPHISYQRALCNSITGYSFTSLGLGDIVVPGICINYALLFDLACSNNIKIYFLLNILGYIVGLFITFIGLVFMNSSQPALFYICPILLVLNILLSLFRKEFKALWRGDIIKKFIDVNTGETRNLSKYKVKKQRAFNILKLTRRKVGGEEADSASHRDSTNSQGNIIQADSVRQKW